jgi:hypothetical protein
MIYTFLKSKLIDCDIFRVYQEHFDDLDFVELAEQVGREAYDDDGLRVFDQDS